MAEINVKSVTEQERDKGKLPVFKDMQDVLEQIRKRAYDLFAWRGFDDGRALDDWLAAEREICWPAAELSEDATGYRLSVSLPGFQSGDISVTAAPDEIIVHATSKKDSTEQQKTAGGAQVLWSDFRSNDVYRRFELAHKIDEGDVSASLKDGILTVTARKRRDVSRRVPVSAAA